VLKRTGVEDIRALTVARVVNALPQRPRA
jgi:hypothetical protein